MTIAVVLLLLVAGSLLFHVLSPWYFTPIASNWGSMDDTVSLTFVVTGAVFVAVNGFIAWCVIRYRARPGSRAAYEPESARLEWWLTGLTSLGVAAMLAPGLFVWADFVEPPEDAAEVEVFAQQWNWMFRLPGADRRFGRADAALVAEDNPLGVDPGDPAAQDDVLVTNPVLHLPRGEPVKLLLRSVDVLHNFTVPQFRAKMDFVPGMVTFVWLAPTRAGSFDLLCEELCGIGHFAMRGSVVVEERAAWETWLAAQPTFAASRSAVADPAAGAAAWALCATCHGAEGEGNAAMHAPRLAGQQGWYLARQLEHFRQGLRGAHEADTWGRTMAPMAATLADAAAVRNVVAHIAGFPVPAAQGAPPAGAARAERLYRTTCGACHGADGRGRRSVNAPAIAGMEDWYLAAQLQNFRQGVRGQHPQDMYGLQMALMARTLADEQAVADMAAYVNAL